MPTLAQLQSESWWTREIVPAALDAVFRQLCAHFDSDPLGGGTRGNEFHDYGRHRSLAWCLNSRFCTDRSYGTQDKRDRDGDPNHIRAIDVKLNRTQIREVSRRLDAAVRAGRAPMVAEWFGTFDNVNVSGWYEGHASSADDSHLEHVHVGVWTIYADDQAVLGALFAIMTGDDTVTPEDLIKLLSDTKFSSPALGVAGRSLTDWLKGGEGAKQEVAKLAATVAAANAADATRDAAVLAAVQALATTGGVEAAPIVTAIEAVRDEARTEFGRLYAENEQLRSALAAAARAEADALDPATP